jgi:hypothetical protein
MGLSKKTMRRCHPLLKIISALGDEERKVLTHFLTHEACEGIYECIQNGLMNPTLPEEDKREMHERLLPQKNKFRKLIKEEDPEKKKRALMQLGEGAGFIVQKVFPLLDKYLQKTK